VEAPAPERPRANVLSVGGSPAPVIASLNAQQPEFVCFFVSAESRASLDGHILPGLRYRPRHHDWIETPSAEDLLLCCQVLARGLPPIAAKWNVPLKDFVADYTGGTKTMSVALALATIQSVGRYSYVGGTERTKDGLGVVVDGKERILHQANPWDVLAVRARQRAALLFNRGRYEAAEEELRAVADLASSEEQTLCRGLATLTHGYAEWDRFEHGQAQETLSRALRTLDPFAAGRSEAAWTDLARRVRAHSEWLQTLKGADGGALRVADLIANAKRRGDLEARYDDAVARLYSALEMAARVRLKCAYHIRTSEAQVEQLPAELRDEYERRYRTPQGHLELPQFAAYRLLRSLHDELGQRYTARDAEIKRLLNTRNSSILAHGDRPVSGSLYRQLSSLVMDVVAVREEDLPAFPQVEW